MSKHIIVVVIMVITHTVRPCIQWIEVVADNDEHYELSPKFTPHNS